MSLSGTSSPEPSVTAGWMAAEQVGKERAIREQGEQGFHAYNSNWAVGTAAARRTCLLEDAAQPLPPLPHRWALLTDGTMCDST